MKGLTKAIKRTPHLMTSKVGLASKSSDPQFDQLQNRFASLEKHAEKLLKDSATFRDSVKNMLLSGSNFGRSFEALFHPLGNEYDLERKHPNAATTLLNISAYQTHMEELKETLTPEIELIDSRVVGPANDFMAILKAIRKNITKRDHKLVDYDRHNNSYTKLKEKKEKTLKDEQNLFKVEQDYETAAADYEYYNNALKEELPKFFDLAARFMTPLFHSFYYMQLNVFYLTLERLQSFTEGKYDLSNNSIANVEQSYADQLTDAAERLEALTIRKGAPPSARILAQNRQTSMSSSGSVGRAGGLSSGAPSRTGTLNRSSTITSSYRTASPTSAEPAAPPAYTTATTTTNVAKGKRPPPPPPTKPKPGAIPPKSYVVALYDYTATAEGDLSFKAGDRIEVVERTASTEDWWTGTINGLKGVFPG
ncbi:BAR-domain-containing protein [Violaceomyces palustris]|uniref:BAR-domain-containing protein n=1 Tax=Violaceomyces palustris TaxID=1673888 RepID=A0ACD0NUW2_9BASI|nr:BAR-domain-containing protein [Violaceomyces palustris]